MKKRALCFGLEPYPLPNFVVDHYPLIDVVGLPFQDMWLEELKKATHLLFTSKTAVKLFPYSEKPVLAIGQGTAKKAEEKGFRVVQIALEETQEGICPLLDRTMSIFWPRSDKARPVIQNHCKAQGIPLSAPPIYTVKEMQGTLPNLDIYSALYFTSPSTVDAFFSLHPALPEMECIAIGEVTKKYLLHRLSLFGGKKSGPYLTACYGDLSC